MMKMKKRKKRNPKKKKVKLPKAKTKKRKKTPRRKPRKRMFQNQVMLKVNYVQESMLSNMQEIKVELLLVNTQNARIQSTREPLELVKLSLL